MRTCLKILAAPLCVLGPLHAQQGPKTEVAPNIVNIVNFIRGVEPREPKDLMKPVVEQLKLGKLHKLPTTYLIQYDALIKPEFVNLLKKEMGPDDEIGVWLEVVQPQVEAAGLKWRGRYPWDWHTDVGFTQGYAVADRLKLMDVLMEKFKQTFGRYPRSVGNWIIDAPTLNHLYDKYHIVAACNCKDQSGTDGYTLWGGYWNQAYYPSRLNAYMPAQTAQQQLNVPVFRMLGSDPVEQYSHGSSVVTLEPVYPHAGGSPDWVKWFFDVNTNPNNPSLAFSYMQAGQENSFGWQDMSKGLIDQYQKLDDLAKQGKVRVETMEKSGTWFRKNFQKTPASSVVALNDAANRGERSIWYESRFYRVNLFWEKDTWKIRDLHLFDESYQERYLEKPVTTPNATYDTLPVVDGYHWGKPEDPAGIQGLLGAGTAAKPFAITGVPVVKQVGKDSLAILSKLATGGEMRIYCEPASLRVELPEAAPSDWSLELCWAADKAIPLASVGPNDVGYKSEGFPYRLQCGSSEVMRSAKPNSILIKPVGKQVMFHFGPPDTVLNSK